MILHTLANPHLTEDCLSNAQAGDTILLLKDGVAAMHGPRDEVLQQLRKNAVTTTQQENEPLPAQAAAADADKSAIAAAENQARLG